MTKGLGPPTFYKQEASWERDLAANTGHVFETEQVQRTDAGGTENNEPGSHSHGEELSPSQGIFSSLE